MLCSDTSVFFQQIASRNFTSQVSENDLNFLRTNNYIHLFSRDEYSSLAEEVKQLDVLRSAENQNEIGLVSEKAEYQKDFRKTHSILFHFEGSAKKEEEIKDLQQHAENIKSTEAKVQTSDSRIADLIQKKSIFDGLTQYGDRYVSMTNQGQSLLHDLQLRMYRVSGTELQNYLNEASETMGELGKIADAGQHHFANLSTAISDVEPSHLWSISIGLAKLQDDPVALDGKFVQSFNLVNDIARNRENALMAAEILASSREDPEKAMGFLKQLEKEVRHRTFVSKEDAAGISAILYFGRSFDGTFPVDKFVRYKSLTESDEAAAIMAIINKPPEEVAGKYNAMRGIFGAWGYEASEDVELASAYLAVSDLPSDGFQTKLGIIIQGIKNYLEYPLVASAIMASVPVMEANETLDLVEKAYYSIGQRAQGLSRSELIGLAVRAIHGIRNETVRDLDTTAKMANTPIQFTYRPLPVWMPIYLPLTAVHYSYFSTFSSIGGAHPGHIHAAGGMQG